MLDETRDPITRLSNAALLTCYVASAVVIVAVYREPIRAMAADITSWYRAQQESGTRSIMGMRGRLWDDVRDALKGSPNGG